MSIQASELQIQVAEGALDPATGGLWRDAWRRLRRNPGAIAGFALVGLFALCAVLAPVIAPHDPNEQDLLTIALHGGCCPGPSKAHPMGLDYLGRDEFSRIIYGARYSLVIGLVAVTAGLSIGLTLGAIAGYMGGWIDSAIMRVMDVMLAIPGLLLAMATAIIDIAGLSFLGLGSQDPNTPEWGSMLAQVDRYLQSAPFLAIFPGIAIVLSVLGFNLIGDALREALDPKLRGRA
jgi:peptide/nickel transport system permease protein